MFVLNFLPYGSPEERKKTFCSKILNPRSLPAKEVMRVASLKLWEFLELRKFNLENVAITFVEVKTVSSPAKKKFRVKGVLRRLRTNQHNIHKHFGATSVLPAQIWINQFIFIHKMNTWGRELGIPQPLSTIDHNTKQEIERESFWKSNRHCFIVAIKHIKTEENI